eukprot:gb/GECG01011591.1/.p1 GENE.gb/GECG01011591.1/~~gb/GECG01011591.1/.p1  ORF type:complete len:119 (+),score=6.34 gb/GECG01011591.1/:1-357(+)
MISSSLALGKRMVPSIWSQTTRRCMTAAAVSGNGNGTVARMPSSSVNAPAPTSFGTYDNTYITYMAVLCCAVGCSGYGPPSSVSRREGLMHSCSPNRCCSFQCGYIYCVLFIQCDDEM